MNTERLPLDSRRSPLDSVSFAIQGGMVKICYGRTAAREREVYGELVPYDQLWRTGANEPTMIHTSVALEVAGVRIDPGSYALYTVPGKSEWEIIVNSSTTQWGHERFYNDEIKAHEVGRGKAKSGSTDEYVESFTISAATGEGGAATLYLEWEETRVAVPISAAN
ncbi:MAG: hypothetical protein AMS21_12025 [Gemmatimonas sp. SG8_38_2]|nr:MAG: hypothetical protein AMS21_12025 [Gemmatimonas sp. SG8_38_2]